MFVEEAAWLRANLARLELPPAARVINVASSTEHYRTVEQPHNDSEVLAPLREGGAAIEHLDLKEDEGVDHVVDLLDAQLDLLAQVGSFDLVLATGLLEHFDEPSAGRVCGELLRITEPGGFLVLTTPQSYRRTLDPVDPGYRPTPDDLVAVLRGSGEVSVVASDRIRIDDPRYYKGIVSRASVVKLGERWAHLPGATERLRRLVPRWRWQESCLIVRREG